MRTSDRTKKSKKSKNTAGKKRGSRTRKKRGISDYRIAILVTALITLAAAVFAFSIYYVVLGNYEGLGQEGKPVHHGYSRKAFYRDGGWMHYEDENYQSMSGIDVSVFQDEIDWKKVKRDGTDFVMIRIGYRTMKSGNIRMDENFRKNLAGAKKAGLGIGIYFFSQAQNADEAVEEAKFVVRHIRHADITYPVAYDMEDARGDRVSELTNKQRTECADAFCTIIEKNGFQPIVYGNPTWLLTKINLAYLTNYPIWLAHYTDRTLFPDIYTMWQYTEKGKVQGIRGHVDKSIYLKKKAD